MNHDLFGVVKRSIQFSRSSPVPVDIVFTYVRRDNSNTRIVKENAKQFDNSYNRFSDHGELLFALRSVFMYVPWVRNVFVVVSSVHTQMPTFLSEDSYEFVSVRGTHRVALVEHSVIYGTEYASHLPTFNSQSIELHLHKIPGLSEHFLYANDDFFLTKPLSFNRFFTENPVAPGTFMPLLRFNAGTIPNEIDAKHTRKHTVSWYNNVKILHKLFPKSVRDSQLYQSHCFAPLTQSVCVELWDRLPNTLARTSHSQVRSDTDVYFVGLLMYYALYTERAKVVDSNSMYIPVYAHTSISEMKALIVDAMRGSTEMLCINDCDDNVWPPHKVTSFQAMMHCIFPFQLPIEITKLHGRFVDGDIKI